jgi:hypothetical protein
VREKVELSLSRPDVFANEEVQGGICYRIKDSEKVRLMTPTQFMARLAALVPHRTVHPAMALRLGQPLREGVFDTDPIAARAAVEGRASSK